MIEDIKKASQGDEKAFEKVMNKFLPDIYNYISFKVNNEADIKDIIQEIMLAIYKGISNYNFKSSFKTWILSITKRKVADYYRLKYAECSTVPIENYVHIKTKENDDIQEIIDHLPSEEKELLNLIFVQRCSYAEVSQIMGIPVGTIKSRMHYLKQKLKPILIDGRR